MGFRNLKPSKTHDMYEESLITQRMYAVCGFERKRADRIIGPVSFLPNSAEAQKMTKKKNWASIDPTAPEARNLVSDPSFKKIFRRDLATVSGTNNLPNGQLILKLNEPEVELGQLFSHYKDKKTIPLFSFYPYVSVSSNTDKEYVVATTSKFDPKIGIGGRLIWIPAGKSRNTYHFFEPYSQNLKTRVFIDKNDLLKTELAKKYKKQSDSDCH